MPNDVKAMEMKARELLPCPFCGATATEKPEDDGVGIYATSGDHWPVAYTIWCEPCGAEMQGSDRDAMIAAWNTRPAMEGAWEGIESLRKWLKHDGLCAIVGGYGYCTCGLDDALAKSPSTIDGGKG